MLASLFIVFNRFSLWKLSKYFLNLSQKPLLFFHHQNFQFLRFAFCHSVPKLFFLVNFNLAENIVWKNCCQLILTTGNLPESLRGSFYRFLWASCSSPSFPSCFSSTSIGSANLCFRLTVRASEAENYNPKTYLNLPLNHNIQPFNLIVFIENNLLVGEMQNLHPVNESFDDEIRSRMEKFRVPYNLNAVDVILL